MPLPLAEPQPVGWSSTSVKAAANPTECSALAAIDTVPPARITKPNSGFNASFNGNFPGTTS